MKLQLSNKTTVEISQRFGDVNGALVYYGTQVTFTKPGEEPFVLELDRKRYREDDAGDLAKLIEGGAKLAEDLA